MQSGGKEISRACSQVWECFFPGYKETLQAPAEVHRRNKELQNKQT